MLLKTIPALISLVALSFGTFLSLSSPLATSAIPSPSISPISEAPTGPLPNAANSFIDYSDVSEPESFDGSQLLVSLKVGSSITAPPIICINGEAFNEGFGEFEDDEEYYISTDFSGDIENPGSEPFTSDQRSDSGSGVFNIFDALDEGTIFYTVWIPYFTGDCEAPVPSDSKFTIALNAGETVTINAVLRPRNSGGGTTIVLDKPTPKPEAPKPDQALVQTTSSTATPVLIPQVAGVVEVIKEDSNYIPYTLKSTHISFDRPILLDANLKVNRTSISSRRPFEITLSNVVRIDTKVQDLNCELISSNSDNSVVATSILDEKGTCSFNWNPANTKRGRTSLSIRIKDNTRNHIYTSIATAVTIR